MGLLEFIGPEDQREEPPLKKAIQNLLNHIPGEAATVYLAGLDVLGDDASLLALTLMAVGGLAVLLLVRFLAKASHAVKVTSAIAFVIWVYAIGGGPFDKLGMQVQGLGAFLVLVFSTVVTVIATYTKWLKW
jgi:hypothetical protein